MNSTRHSLLRKMQKGEVLSRETEQILWHLLYSTKSKSEIDKSLSPRKDGIFNYLIKTGLSEETIEKIKSVKLPDEGYGAYSEKAIKHLLPLMRCGKFWTVNNIQAKTKQRINSYEKR